MTYHTDHACKYEGLKVINCKSPFHISDRFAYCTAAELCDEVNYTVLTMMFHN